MTKRQYCHSHQVLVLVLAHHLSTGAWRRVWTFSNQFKSLIFLMLESSTCLLYSKLRESRWDQIFSSASHNNLNLQGIVLRSHTCSLVLYSTTYLENPIRLCYHIKHFLTFAKFKVMCVMLIMISNTSFNLLLIFQVYSRIMLFELYFWTPNKGD